MSTIHLNLDRVNADLPPDGYCERLPYRRMHEMARITLCAWAILATDLVAIVTSLVVVVLADWCSRAAGWPWAIHTSAAVSFGRMAPACVAAAALVLISFGMLSHYSQRLPHRRERREVVLVAVVGLICTGLAAGLQRPNSDVSTLLLPWIVVPFLLVGLRHVARDLLQRAGCWQILTVVVAHDHAARRAVAALAAAPHLGCQIVRIADLRKPRSGNTAESWRDLQADCNAQLIVTTSDMPVTQALHLTDRWEHRPVEFATLWPPTDWPTSHHRIRLLTRRNDIVVHYTNGPANALARQVKLAFDWSAALVAMVLLAPVLGLIMLAVKSDGGPAFFAHTRIGRGGRTFGCLKFRSMVTNGNDVLAALLASDPVAAAEWEASRKLRKDPRITRIGHLLRATSLDEIPQLINVLRLEMSLVGPRPIVIEEVVRYGDNIASYYAGRPGLTGLWQVSGRSDTSYAQRVALDTEYVSQWSLWRDFSIIARTIPAVLRSRGAC